MDCEFTTDGRTKHGQYICRCIHCGRRSVLKGECGAVRAMCQSEARPTRQPAVGLGDLTERLLKKIGIDESRYVEAKKLFGLAPNCGCAKRRKWLNKVGKHFGIG